MIETSYNRERLGGWALFAVYAVLAAATHREISGHATIVYLGDYNLTSVEVVLVIAIAAILHSARWSLPRLNAVTGWTVVFSLIVGFGVVRGLFVNPLAALIALRATGVFVAFLILGLYLPMQDAAFEKIRTAIVAVAFLLVVLLMLRMVFGPSLFFQTEFMSELEINDGGRGLAAPGATIIAVAAALSLSAVLRSSASTRRAGKWIVIFVLLSMGLLLTRQATAVVAGLGGLGVVLALEKGPGRAARLLMVIGLLAVAAVSYLLAPGLFSTETLGSLLPDWVAGDLSQRAKNLYTRQLIWSGLLADFRSWSLLDQFFGLPAGTKPRVLVLHWGGLYWQPSIHSMYFGTLPYAGLLGLAAYAGLILALLVRALRRVFRVESNSDHPLSAALIVALCTVLLIFGLSYELRNEQSLFLAMTIAAARSTVPLKRARRSHSGTSSVPAPIV